ncbi:MAG: RNA polymerase sigma factor [Christensenellales bacterium]
MSGKRNIRRTPEGDGAHIIYRFSDALVKITIEQYRAEVADGTEDGFSALRQALEEMWLAERRANWRQTHKNISLNALNKHPAVPSAEDSYFQAMEDEEEDFRFKQQLRLAYQALNSLSSKQRRRFLLHAVMGKTLEETAEIEQVSLQSVHESICRARQLIAQHLAQSDNTP